MPMDLLDKFDAVTVKADARITPDDKAYCEAHQAAYDAAIQSFQELAFFWEDMESTQKELLGSSDTSYLSSRDGPDISRRQINAHLEHLHQSLIYNIVHYFNSTYHVSVSADYAANNLLPQKPDLRVYENKEAHDAYHEKLRAAKIRYEDVVDQIIDCSQPPSDDISPRLHSAPADGAFCPAGSKQRKLDTAPFRHDNGFSSGYTGVMPIKQEAIPAWK